MNIKRLLFLSLATAIIFTGCGATGRSGTTQSSLDTTFLQSQFWLPTEQIIYDENGNETLRNTFEYDEEGMLVSASLYNGSTATQTNERTDNSVTCTTFVTTNGKSYEAKRTYVFNENDVLISQDWGEDHSFSQTQEGNGVNSFLDENGDPFMSIYGHRYIKGAKFPLYSEVPDNFPTPYSVANENGDFHMEYDIVSQTYTDYVATVRSDKKYQNLLIFDYPYGLWQNKTVNAEKKTVTTTVLYKSGNICEKVTWRPTSKKAAQIFYYSDIDQLECSGALKFLNYEVY